MQNFVHQHRPCCHVHLRISNQLVQQSNGINRVSLTRGIAATHMPESIWCILAVSASSSTGNVIGPETSSLRWPSYALAIPRCWQDICTISGAMTLPPVHTATTLTRQQSTWSYSVQLTARLGGTSGQHESSTQTLNASGTSWSGSR